MADTSGSELSTGEVMLASLLEAAHTIHPDELPAVVRRAAGIAGLRDARIYVVDYEQRVLTALDDPSVSLGIDATVGGRAYRRSEELRSDGLVWFPLIDGSDRLGILSVRLTEEGALALGRGRALASLVANLIVVKSAYGDCITTVARRQEMALSAELRWALAAPLTFSSPRVAVAGSLEPPYRVAGDAFDFAVNADTLHVAVFDAMGHGLPAARLANLALLAYRHGRRGGAALEPLYRGIDEVVGSVAGPDAFVTAQLLELDLPTGRLRRINAGHPEPLILRRRTAAQLSCEPAPPLGLGERRAQAVEYSLEPDDILLLYTDGVVEARSPIGEEFGVERLADLFSRTATSDETLAEKARRLTHAVLQHQQGHLDDDATLLLVHWNGPT